MFQPSESNDHRKYGASESRDSRRVLNTKLMRVVTFGTLQYSGVLISSYWQVGGVYIVEGTY